MTKWLPLLVFLVILGCARLVGAATPEAFGNLQPYGALFFCGMVFCGSRWLWAPALAWLLTVPMTSAMQGYDWTGGLLSAVLGFAAVVALAKFFQGRSLAVTFAGSLLGGLAFYLISTVVTWLGSPLYPQTLNGLGQALWTGVPGYPPSYLFFRNGMIAQALFTGVFFLAYFGIRLRIGSPSSALVTHQAK